MLAELKARLDEEDRFLDQDPDFFAEYEGVRRVFEKYLDFGSKHKGNFFESWKLYDHDKIERETDVFIKGKKYLLLVYAMSLDPRGKGIGIVLYNRDRSTFVEVGLPTSEEFKSLIPGYDDIGETLRKVKLIKKDILPIVSRQVKKDYKLMLSLTPTIEERL